MAVETGTALGGSEPRVHVIAATMIALRPVERRFFMPPRPDLLCPLRVRRETQCDETTVEHRYKANYARRCASSLKHAAPRAADPYSSSGVACDATHWQIQALEPLLL
jgi:hypothetical protein